MKNLRVLTIVISFIASSSFTNEFEGSDGDSKIVVQFAKDMSSVKIDDYSCSKKLLSN